MEISNIHLENPFIAAPLAGITDAPTRRINKSMGAALVYSEMISGKGLVYNNKNTEALLKIYDDEKPVAFQIFGADPDVMAKTTEKLNNRENAILDINMGCPVPKVVKNGEGSALLKDLQGVFDVTRAVVQNTDKPVTVKIRTGWDEDSINAVSAAATIQEAGASAVTVHGRTRSQFYTGKANWDIIKAVKEKVDIPVIGNGDIFTAQDALNMMEYTKCDGVMIARGMQGNPWIFREAIALWERNETILPPTLEEKVDMMVYHFSELEKEKGERVAINEMRKHLAWYTKGVKNSVEFRRRINVINNPDELRRAIESLLIIAE